MHLCHPLIYLFTGLVGVFQAFPAKFKPRAVVDGQKQVAQIERMEPFGHDVWQTNYIAKTF
jgi:hypothetical protein